MEKPFNEMTIKEKSNYRKKLIENNESYCTGILCKGKVKPLDEFPKNRYRECKECYYYRKKQLYDKSGTSCWREKTRLKQDQKCVECECDDIELLEFDHIDPTDKEFTICSSSSARKIIKEAKKTQFLCVWCHRLKSKEGSDKTLKKSDKDFEYTPKENTEVIDPKNSKICNGELCKGKKRNNDKFYKMKNKYSYRCIKCIGYKTMIIRRKNAKIVDNEKLKIGKCNDCGEHVTEETLCCFDFDHLDQVTKTCTLASLRMANKPVDKEIKEELEKCQLLCCCCHRKKTIKQMNHWDISKEEFAKYEHMKIKEKQVYTCPLCNENEMDRDAKACLKCHRIKSRKVTRPSFETLESDVAEHGYVHTGKKYGVSNVAIRKWLDNYIKNENKQPTKIQMKI